MADALTTVSKRAIQKTAEATGGLIGNKITDRASTQNSPETVKYEHDKEILKERYISQEERLKIIDDLRLT